MRFFIALEIPNQSRQSLKIVQQKLKDIIPEVHLTDPNELHLTIAFIGEQPDNFVEDFKKVINKAVLGISPFQIIPAYIDGFPNIHHPHTLWAGVKGDIDKLFVLRERIKDGFVELGLYMDERRYIPHIAMGKINSSYDLSIKQEALLQEIAVKEDFGPVQITSIKLFESIPEEGFHKQNTLAEVHLQ
ncbi:MAG: RNA 2',3'-cyclic phosphodiesterase [Microgenomates group bacterium]|jgi:2'-5' RNA ligase